jgi:hypothetical protein
VSLAEFPGSHQRQIPLHVLLDGAGFLARRSSRMIDEKGGRHRLWKRAVDRLGGFEIRVEIPAADLYGTTLDAQTAGDAEVFADESGVLANADAEVPRLPLAANDLGVGDDLD